MVGRRKEKKPERVGEKGEAGVEFLKYPADRHPGCYRCSFVRQRKISFQRQH